MRHHLRIGPVVFLWGLCALPAWSAVPLCVDRSGGDPVALTDGLLVIRSPFGFSGSTLTHGALFTDATRTDPAAAIDLMHSGTPAVAVPGLIGLAQTDATDALATAGLTLSTVTEVFADATRPIATGNLCADGIWPARQPLANRMRREPSGAALQRTPAGASPLNAPAF